MRILIGGSPSTGSSLFRQILNRHPAIYCGPETQLFCHSRLYHHWKKSRRRLLLPDRIGLRQTDVRTLRGVHLTDQEIGWNRDDLQKLIKTHLSFPAFCDAFYEKPLSESGKQHWAEKTPANVLHFVEFREHFEDIVLLHTIRAPYDTVSSLVSRGMSAYQAASVYLLYTAHGLAVKADSRYIELRYEDLVNDPALTMTRDILTPLHLDFHVEMLAEGNPHMASGGRMQGWRSDEVSRVSDKSISRFDDDPMDTRIRIATALASVRIKESYAAKHGLSHISISELCSAMQYPFFASSDLVQWQYFSEIQRDRRQVMRALWIDRFFSPSSDYPIEIVRP